MILRNKKFDDLQLSILNQTRDEFLETNRSIYAESVHQISIYRIRDIVKR